MKRALAIVTRVLLIVLACFMLMSGIVVINEELNTEEGSTDIGESTETQTGDSLVTGDDEEQTSGGEMSADKIISDTGKIEISFEGEITYPEDTSAEEEEELYLELTPEEKLILATIIRLECGGSSYECQMAVASVVINRMNYWGMTLRETVFAKNVFSTSRHIDRETGKSKYAPYETNWQVVEDICRNGPSIPYYVMYFRSGHYHDWAIPYMKIDSTYFSYVKKYM